MRKVFARGVGQQHRAGRVVDALAQVQEGIGGGFHEFRQRLGFQLQNPGVFRRAALKLGRDLFQQRLKIQRFNDLGRGQGG